MSASRRRPARMLARSGHMEYDRILFFSDAVFAIAITLLIVDLPAPIEQMSSALHHPAALSSSADLRHAASAIGGFWLSFAVIGLFWVGHHGLFRFITAIDRPLMLLNLLFIGTIAFLPYPTALLSSVSSSQAPAVIFYAVCAGSAGLLETVIWLYASRAGLVSGMSPEMSRLYLLRTARIPVTFGLSILIALVAPRAATYFWAALVVLGIAINHRYGRHEADDDPAAAATPAA
jgi:uncharacterized membrane protein